MDATLPLRIVHFIPHLRGAAGQLVVHLAVEQQRRAPGCVAVVLSEDADATWATTSPALVEACRGENVAVFWCGEFFRREVSQLHDAARLVRRDVLDGQPWSEDAVAHAHTAMGAVVARRAGAPRVVATLHGVGTNRPREYDMQDDVAWLTCDALVVGNEETACQIRDARGHAHVFVVPPPRMPEVVPGLASVRHGRRIVYAGTFDAESQPARLVDAMPFVWERLTDATLHLLGDGDDRTLKARAAAVDPEGQRIVVERAPDGAAARLGRFDLFASASEMTPASREAFTALAIGLPTVAPASGELGGMVRDGRCGLAVPTAEPRDLGLAMAVLLETDDAARAELGDAGRRYAAATSGMSAHVSALESIYAGRTRPSRRVSPIALDGPVRLHLGSGGERRPGWLNVDTRPEVMPDLVARVDTLPMVADASVDEIEACHLFEHLPLHEAHAALREWARVLKPGGRLFLELPNFEACVRILGTAVDGAGYDFGMIGIFGWPPAVETDGDAMAHRWGWTPVTLARALEAAGFTDVQRLPVTQTYRPATRYDRDFRMSAVRSGHDGGPG